MEKYPCPCCGYLTYPVPREDAIAYICPSLRKARENYRSFGACARTMPRYVREPKPEEIPQ